MKQAKDLLEVLGVQSYTPRHLKTIEQFLEGCTSDAGLILDSLGEWDANDLRITDQWLAEYYAERESAKKVKKSRMNLKHLTKEEKKAIHKQQVKRYAEDNRDKLKAYSKVWCEANKERLKINSARWDAKHPGQRKINGDKWIAANKQHKREYSAAYREANREMIRERYRARYLRLKNAKKKTIELKDGETGSLSPTKNDTL